MELRGFGYHSNRAKLAVSSPLPTPLSLLSLFPFLPPPSLTNAFPALPFAATPPHCKPPALLRWLLVSQGMMCIVGESVDPFVVTPVDSQPHHHRASLLISLKFHITVCRAPSKVGPTRRACGLCCSQLVNHIALGIAAPVCLPNMVLFLPFVDFTSKMRLCYSACSCKLCAEQAGCIIIGGPW